VRAWVTAADEARRRIERDLHDGAQQRLVGLGLKVRSLEASLPADSALKGEMVDLADALAAANEELRQISHGIHPAVLSTGGLRPALRSLGRRAAVPVDLRITVEKRLPESVEGGGLLRCRRSADQRRQARTGVVGHCHRASRRQVSAHLGGRRRG